jgi:ribosomal protein L11 methyltransferase
VEERAGWFVAYFEEPASLDGFLERARSSLAVETGLEPLLLEHAWQDHEAWEETWRRGLGPRRITDRIVVHPSWAPPEQVSSEDVVVVLDPGMAFGTAEHGTTRGCLRLLDVLVRPEERVLDVGAGSGILSVTAALLGAAGVLAVEGDALACEAMAENIDRNGVGDRVTIDQAWASSSSIEALAPVDGIVANIETGMLEPLFPGFAKALAPGGWLLVSGILAEEWVGVRKALESVDFRLVGTDEDGGWCTGAFRREGGG